MSAIGVWDTAFTRIRRLVDSPACVRVLVVHLLQASSSTTHTTRTRSTSSDSVDMSLSSPDNTLYASYERVSRLSWARKSKISGMSEHPSDWST